MAEASLAFQVAQDLNISDMTLDKYVADIVPWAPKEAGTCPLGDGAPSGGFVAVCLLSPRPVGS